MERLEEFEEKCKGLFTPLDLSPPMGVKTTTAKDDGSALLHDPPPNTTPRNSVHRTCPNLAIDLSPVQTCSSALSTVETLAVVVELVFEGVELEETSLVEPHEHVLAFVRRKLRLDMGGRLGSEAWEMMARVLCPSGGARGGGLTSGRDLRCQF